MTAPVDGREAEPQLDLREPEIVVEVIRSTRRRKTSQARMRNGVLEVRIPSWLSEEEEAQHVAHFVDRMQRRTRSDEIDLAARAARLAERYDLPEPHTIRWVTNQTSRWGSCTPAHGTIRLSDRLAGFPAWVVDYVIVHELAHLVEADHGPRFHALVDRYPRAERARGFLIAKGWEADASD